MIKPIQTNRILLSQKCLKVDVGAEDLPEKIKDLVDTAKSLKEECHGLAFNQISEWIRGFVLRAGEEYKVFINPEYVFRVGGMKSMLESCISKPNEDPVKKRRYKRIKLQYYDMDSQSTQELEFKQFGARIIQHEMDHLDGVLI